MIVADTCLVTHLFNESDQTLVAKKVLRKDSQWILPTLWQEEYANVLSKIARKESIEINLVLKQFHYAMDTLKGGTIPVSPAKALRIAIEYKISVYDAHFVALAMDYNVVMVSEDKEVLKNCPGIAVCMHEFLCQ